MIRNFHVEPKARPRQLHCMALHFQQLPLHDITLQLYNFQLPLHDITLQLYNFHYNFHSIPFQNGRSWVRFPAGPRFFWDILSQQKISLLLHIASVMNIIEITCSLPIHLHPTKVENLNLQHSQYYTQVQMP